MNLVMKYTWTILEAYFKYTSSYMKYTSTFCKLQPYTSTFWNAIVFHFWVRSILEVDFQNLQIYIQTQKYTWRGLSKLMCLSSNFEVYLKQTFNIDAFILKLWSILEVDFLNLWIYVQTQNYVWSRFPKSIISFQTHKFNLSILHFRKSQEV